MRRAEGEPPRSSALRRALCFENFSSDRFIASSHPFVPSLGTTCKKIVSGTLQKSTRAPSSAHLPLVSAPPDGCPPVQAVVLVPGPHCRKSPNNLFPRSLGLRTHCSRLRQQNGPGQHACVRSLTHLIPTTVTARGNDYHRLGLRSLQGFDTGDFRG